MTVCQCLDPAGPFFSGDLHSCFLVVCCGTPRCGHSSGFSTSPHLRTPSVIVLAIIEERLSACVPSSVRCHNEPASRRTPCHVLLVRTPQMTIRAVSVIGVLCSQRSLSLGGDEGRQETRAFSEHFPPHRTPAVHNTSRAVGRPAVCPHN